MSRIKPSDLALYVRIDPRSVKQFIDHLTAKGCSFSLSKGGAGVVLKQFDNVESGDMLRIDTGDEEILIPVKKYLGRVPKNKS